MPSTHCYAAINSGNGHVINDHLQAKKTAVFHECQTRFALRHHHHTSSNVTHLYKTSHMSQKT